MGPGKPEGARAYLPERRDATLPQLRRAVVLRPERTFEQDPKYPLRLLVDIAIKALSPAINDPTTAVQAIDQIEDLLRRLGRRDLDAGYARDTDGSDSGNVSALLGEVGHEQDGEIPLADRIENIRSAR